MTRATMPAVLVFLASCGRHASDDGTLARRAQPSSSVDAGPPQSGADGAATRRDEEPRPGRRWHGTYRSESASVFVPPEWKGVSWSVPPTSDGLGDGAMDIEIDGSRVSGSIDGPLGPAILDGVVSASVLSASVLRRDSTDRGYAGTLFAKIGGDGVQGTMNLSLGEASAVRTATFSLPSPP